MKLSLFPAAILAISFIGSAAMALRYRAAIATSETANLPPPIRRAASQLSPAPAVSPDSPVLRDERKGRLRRLLTLTDPLARSRALILLVDELGPADFPLLLDACREMHLTPEADVCRLLLTAWTKLSPADAIAWADGDLPALKIVIAAWSSLDPRAAFAWVDRHAAGKQAGQLLPLVIPAITTGDPEAATAKLAALDQMTRTATLPGIAAVIMKRGDAGIESWLDSFAAGRPRREALAAVVANISVDHPREALQWLSKYPGDLDDGRYPASGATGLFTAWSDRDPAAALEAFAALAPGTAVHREALQGMIEGQALKQDPAALAGLLNQYPAELDFILVYRGIALTHEKEPALALDILSHMPPNQNLAEYYGAVLGEWFAKEPAAARNWLGAHEVPDEVRKQFGGE